MDHARIVRVLKNWVGESGGFAVFDPGWVEIQKKVPEEFDRSKITTRFERKDVI